MAFFGAPLFKDLSPAQAQALLTQGKATLIDVRESSEYPSQGRVEGAKPIPLRDLPRALDDLEATEPYILMCHLGQRSAAAAHYMANQGFDEVYNLEGGIDRWEKEGLPVVR